MTKYRPRRYYPRRPLQPAASPSDHRTLIFCKPYNVLSAFTGPAGRSTVGDYVPVAGVYAAGRLDYNREGLLLLTSDGRLAHRITHPKYKLPKVCVGGALERLGDLFPLSH